MEEGSVVVKKGRRKRKTRQFKKSGEGEGYSKRWRKRRIKGDG